MPEWSAVLDDLERRLDAQVDDAEVAEPWDAPTGLGPLPAPFQARAEELLARQRTVMAERAAELARLGTELRESRRPPARYPAEAPVYLDTLG
ncbi:MAG: hypothetical protein JWP66_1792 [Naasia sp.]|nr:hypothetical protein [Naasia sp.]